MRLSVGTECERLFYWLGSPRSIHHAVMYWALSGAPGPVCHRDNVIRPMMPDHESLQRRSRSERFPLHGVEESRTISLAFERAQLRGVLKVLEHNSETVRAGRTDRIFCLRDPFNQFASYLELRKQRRVALDPIPFAHLWVRQLRFAMKREWRIVDSLRWAAEKEYRAELAAALELSPKPGTEREVAHHGNGSSFTFQEAAPGEEDLKTRWRLYAEDPEWRRMTRVADLTELAGEWFPELTETVLAEC